ncbi:hypothetical protein OE766_25005 [Pararhizobium sp. YC-54]|uniref:hypothetical protein n=1 Tax=Pararhizobium sp. YC-54 TaxID=2986920 RepID=UPI0021F7F74A|nr:hypothetical protein [Pararhizobium sp. YC-54]MCW0001485.1 hypothetical protein [Pararhizobium sp. YC-54]
MSEIIEFQGERFRVRRYPGPITRWRAIRAMRAYHKAEQPYMRLLRQYETLKAQREAMLSKLSSLVEACADESERKYCVCELSNISDRFCDLSELLEEAKATLIVARKAVERVLDSVGFEPVD